MQSSAQRLPVAQYFMIMKKLFLFDIDGTLTYSKHRIGYRLTYDAFEELTGVAVPDDHPSSFAGKTDLQIFRELAADFDVDSDIVERQCVHVSAALERRFAEYATPEWIALLPGASELVRSLAGHDDIVLGLLTGNVKPSAYMKLRCNGLDEYFSFGAFGCDHADRTKLPPIALERAHAHTGMAFTSENTVIVGDAVGDITCAKAHGMKVFGVATGGLPAGALREYGADIVVDDFSRVDEVCELMRGM